MSRSVYPPRSSWEQSQPSKPLVKPVVVTKPKRERSKLRLGTKAVSGLFLVATTGVMVVTLIFSANGKAIQPRLLQHAPKTSKVEAAIPAAVTTLARLNGSDSCSRGTVLTVVAHEDDDLLFMTPDLLHEISAGKCMRTVFVTAGDDGQSASYWQEREKGPLAAYAAMYQLPDDWTMATAHIGSQPVTAYSLVGQPHISLVFLRLPDGNLKGTGFSATKGESLHLLNMGQLRSITSVDGASTYSRPQLIAVFGAIMDLDKPNLINTQAFGPALASGDHSDHQAVGYMVSLARQLYDSKASLVRYLGYQSSTKPSNLSEDETGAKGSIFTAYQQYDTVICDNSGACPGAETYTAYLSRQYVQSGAVGTLPLTPPKQ